MLQSSMVQHYTLPRASLFCGPLHLKIRYRIKRDHLVSRVFVFPSLHSLDLSAHAFKDRKRRLGVACTI